MPSIKKKMPNVNFLFDIVVTRLSCPNEKIDNPEKCQVNIVFNKFSISITSSRINVNDFHAARRLEFESDPEKLRQSLEKAGMPIVIRYGGTTIGTGHMEFPEAVLNKIDFGMNDLMHADTCDILRKDQKIGIVELLCRITIKCDELVSGLDERPRTCSDLSKVINKQDIMFLMGIADPCPLPEEPCNDAFEPEEGDARLHLDIDRYRSINSRAILSSAEESQPEVVACHVLRKVTENYVEVIDSVTKRIKELEPSFSPKHEPAGPTLGNEMGDMPDIFASADRTIPIPLGDMEQRGIKPIRHCPICLFSMSWLPKYACCPNCGAKPMAVFKESPRSKLTADKVMDEVLVKPQAVEGAEDFCVDPCAVKASKDCSEDANDKNTASRCTCKGGKMCAHCRIRKLCEDIFVNKSDTTPHCPKVDPKSDEDFCVIAETEANCRPYLVRVFSELRDLYKINDTKKATELKTRCTQSLMTIKTKRSVAGPTVMGKNGKTISMGALTDRNYAGVPMKLGHKTCVNQNKTVSRRHGWNWTSSPQARHHGWRPGAISRPTSNVMKFFLDHETRKSVYNVCQKVLEQNRQRNGDQQPVLNVSKRNGETFVTLRPLRTLGMEQHPIVFKIVKSDLAKALREIARSLKDKGFAKCSCHQTLRLCTCRSDQDKRNLCRALNKECKRRHMSSCADHLILTDTSESEFEFNINITPPAGTRKPIMRSKSRTANRLTQTNKADRKYMSRYPIEQSPYSRAFDCAVGDRYMGTAFGGLTESVFEDGVFGYRGGGQHGQPVPPRHQKIWGPKAGAPLRFKDKTKPLIGKAWKDLPQKVLSNMRKMAKK